MEIFSNAWHVISISVAFIFGIFFSVFISKFFAVSVKRAFLIYVWHTFFCLVYCWFVIYSGGDSLGYFNAAQSPSWSVGVGSQAVIFLTSIFVNVFGLSFLGVFLVFNIFGVVGLLAFDGSLKLAVQGKQKSIRILASIVIFLPSISFWSSAIGKDALAFMATGLALWSALDLSRRAALMAFAVLVMFWVRPHIAGIMVLALVVSTLFDSRVSLRIKSVLSAASVLASIVLVPFALRYAGLGDDITIKSISEYVERRQSYNMDGGGGVDISSMSLPFQMFTYLFRPVLFEARNLFSFAAAVDNFIILILFVMGLYSFLIGRRSRLSENSIFMLAFIFGSWLILSVTTANLGIAVRQKWMFAPLLIFLLLSVSGRHRSRYVGNYYG